MAYESQVRGLGCKGDLGAVAILTELTHKCAPPTDRPRGEPLHDLHSPRAVQVAIFVIRTFMRMHRPMAEHAQIVEELAEQEPRLVGQYEAIDSLVQAIRRLMDLLRAPSSGPPVPARRSVAFKVQERRPVYQVRRPGRRARA